NYLYGDNAKANELIKKDNPEMTYGQLAYSIAKMKEYGIIESGDSLDKCIGCITDAHYKTFFNEMVAIKVFKPLVGLLLQCHAGALADELRRKRFGVIRLRLE
ncbi:hypothetical protein ACC720_37640, partial [Rhizobium ruizarguesonis]